MKKQNHKNLGWNSMYLAQTLVFFLSLDFLPRFHFIWGPNNALIIMPISFSPYFVSPDHLISTQIHCPNLTLDFSSPSIVPSLIPTGVALRADCSWIFEVSRFFKSRLRFDFLSELQCSILFWRIFTLPCIRISHIWDWSLIV